MPISNSTDEDVSVTIQPPSGGTGNTRPPWARFLAAAVVLGAGALVWGLSGGHPVTAAAGAVIAAASAAWILARRRETRRPTVAPRNNSLPEGVETQESWTVIKKGETLYDPMGFTKDSVVKFKAGGNLVAMVTFENGGCAKYLNPPDDDFNLTSLDKVLIDFQKPDDYKVTLSPA